MSFFEQARIAAKREIDGPESEDVFSSEQAWNYSITWTKKMALDGVKRRPDFLYKVPVAFRTYQVCMEAVKTVPDNIKLVPREIFLKHLENFLEVHPEHVYRIFNKDIPALFEDKEKLKRIICAAPALLGDVYFRDNLFNISYDEVFVDWVKENFPKKWIKLLADKKNSDDYYITYIATNDNYMTSTLGPPTKYGLRVTWDDIYPLGFACDYE